jgi:hypothetical protein
MYTLILLTFSYFGTMSRQLLKVWGKWQNGRQYAMMALIIEMGVVPPFSQPMVMLSSFDHNGSSTIQFLIPHLHLIHQLPGFIHGAEWRSTYPERQRNAPHLYPLLVSGMHRDSSGACTPPPAGFNDEPDRSDAG